MRCGFDVRTAELNMRRRWSGLLQGRSRSTLLKRMGGVMQCLGCGADNKMLLMDVLRDDTMKVPVIEHQIYMCSACRHIARRLVFSRAKMPITQLPVIPISIDKLWKERVAAPRT